jgi:hypothetical protein
VADDARSGIGWPPAVCLGQDTFSSKRALPISAIGTTFCAVYVLDDNIVDEIGMEIARQVKRRCKWRVWRRAVLAACRQ